VIVHRHDAAFVFELVASLHTAQGSSPWLNVFSACCLAARPSSASLLLLAA
jgi:hypothetical protein